MEINSGIQDLFNRLMMEALVDKIAKEKLEAGEELTAEEVGMILQYVYSLSQERFNGFKRNANLKASAVLNMLPVLTLLGGEKSKGMHDASIALKTGLKDVKSNYQLVMTGVSIVSNCQTSTNFITLLDQFHEATNYQVLLGELFSGISARNKSYKRDHATPIVPEAQEKLIVTRQKILTLSKQYETNKKVK